MKFHLASTRQWSGQCGLNLRSASLQSHHFLSLSLSFFASYIFYTKDFTSSALSISGKAIVYFQSGYCDSVVFCFFFALYRLCVPLFPILYFCELSKFLSYSLSLFVFLFLFHLPFFLLALFIFIFIMPPPTIAFL